MKSIRQLSCNLLQRQIIKMKMAVAPTGSRIIFFLFFLPVVFYLLDYKSRFLPEKA